VTPRGAAEVAAGATDEVEADGVDVAGTDDRDEECDEELQAPNSVAVHTATTKAQGARLDRERVTTMMRPPSGRKVANSGR
jgi:hypothetical protein